MITCEELDELFTAMCDLTRQMPHVDRIREIQDLLVRVEQEPRRFLLQWRAASIADLHYLDGVSLRQIALQAGVLFQSISQWLQAHGPNHYLMVRKIDDAPAELKVLKVESPRETKVLIKKCRAAGFRIAPAAFNLLDGEKIRDHGGAEQLWKTLEEQAAGSS